MSEFIKIYDLEEEKNIQTTSLLKRHIFSPITYLDKSVNFIKIRSKKEFYYYVDSSHWHDIENTVNSKLRGLTYEEFEKLKYIASKIWNFSSDFHHQTTARSDLLTHLYQRRLINNLYPDAQTILEIGPGSGYLSLLLAIDGKKVYSTDITQSLYVWQNFLFNQFDLLTELVDNNNNLDFHESMKGIIHVPWWKFANFDKYSIKIDLVTINHAICEMDIGSIKYILSLTNKIGRPKIFMEGLGSIATSIRNNDKIKQIFRIYGYKLIYNKDDVYLYEYDQNVRKLKLSDFMSFIAFLPFIRNFLRYVKKEFIYTKSIIKIFTRRFQKKMIVTENSVTHSEILEFYKKLTNNNLFSNDDEKFIEEIEPKGGILNKIYNSSFYD